MIAPSEKHLQDYIFAHPDKLGFCDGQYEGEIYPDYEIFKREASLPSGRADFLATTLESSSYAICPIETKKEEITSKSLAQCLRYMRDIKMIWGLAIRGLPDPDPSAMHFALIPKVAGLLIGASVTDDVLVSAQGANVQVALYDFDGTDYTFTFQDTPNTLGACFDYAYGYIGEEVRRIYMDYLSLVFQPDKIAAMYIGLTMDQTREYYRGRGLIND